MIDRCFIDLDGTLVDFTCGVYELLRKETPPKPEDQTWGFVHSDEWVKMDYRFTVKLKPTTFCFSILNYCLTKFRKENICILTAPWDTEGCVEGKRDWVKKYIPGFEKRMLFGEAKYFCANSHSLLIDDKEENINSFKEWGGKGALVPQAWNKNKGKPIDYMFDYIDTLL